MRVLVAEVQGMCFGVRDALARMDRIEEPETVTIYGELVHNEVVLSSLAARGFRTVPEEERGEIPATRTVLITAHGVSDRERRRLEDVGKHLVDTTCPLVLRVHRAAQSLQQKGFHVLLIGRRNHVEVRGVIEDLDSFDVIERVEDVRAYPHERLGIICQTTASARHVEAIRAAIVARNPKAEIRFVDTVCHPTKDHQGAVERLLPLVDAMVVVGGRNSNNTRELVALCHDRHVRALHVQSADEIDPHWFAGCETVGLTAGTSTLDATIEEVRQALARIEPVDVG